MQSNAVIVPGRAGTLLIDPGVLGPELACLADDLSDPTRAVVAGFSTHPHWDHLLWHPALGTPPRYATARCAAVIGARLADPDWRTGVAARIPPDIVDDVPLGDQFGRVTGLPADPARLPWDGPRVRVIEHQAHAPGHAALLIEEHGVLVAGDMLSDILIPMLNLIAPDPVGDYLAALRLLDAVADDVEVVIPGHGSVGGADEVRTRIDRDLAYVEGLRDGRAPDDPRMGASAVYGGEMSGVHERQLQHLAGMGGSR